MPQLENKWDRRIDRARELAAAYPFATEVLHFYSNVAEFQKGNYVQFQSACGSACENHVSLPPALDAADLDLLTSRIGLFLVMIECNAPGPLARFARDLSARGPAAYWALLSNYWQSVATHQAGRPAIPGEADSESSPGEIETRHFEQFCARAYLQPYAELLADQSDRAEPEVRYPICPFCGSRPLVGVLRQEGDGAKRSLICSFCRTEWDYLRISCPACEESDEKKLCVYATERFPNVRIEACDTCRRYLKTIDLSKDGRAVPEVDELAAVPLTLWAEEKGYSKITPNILGV